MILSDILLNFRNSGTATAQIISMLHHTPMRGKERRGALSDYQPVAGDEVGDGVRRPIASVTSSRSHSRSSLKEPEIDQAGWFGLIWSFSVSVGFTVRSSRFDLEDQLTTTSSSLRSVVELGFPCSVRYSNIRRFRSVGARLAVVASSFFTLSYSRPIS